MRRRIVGCIIVAFVFLNYSCDNLTRQAENVEIGVEKNIMQKEDGTISLNMENADCYSDMVNPGSNTAEWNVVVFKSGRFNVWLSSATKDTNDLHYENSVMFNIHDDRLVAHPACDKVVHNSKDVSYPYFQADSFMGSLYIQDTGIYNIQIISDKIVPKGFKHSESTLVESTKLISVFLTPTTN